MSNLEAGIAAGNLHLGVHAPQHGCTKACLHSTSTEPREIRHYELRVNRGARAGLVKTYGYSQRSAARRFADKLDREYGAICASVRPVFVEG